MTGSDLFCNNHSGFLRGGQQSGGPNSYSGPGERMCHKVGGVAVGRGKAE